TAQFQRLAEVARDENEYIGEQFLQWFLQEQVEEVARMSTLLNVVDRPNGNLFDVETFVARDMPSEANGGQSAPGTAGPSVSSPTTCVSVPARGSHLPMCTPGRAVLLPVLAPGAAY